MISRITLVLSSALSLAACSSSAAPADMGPPDMMTPTEAELVAERPYTVAVPSGYDAAQKYPLLIVLAGFGSMGSSTSLYLGFTQLAADQGAFLVTPDPDAPHARFAWNPNPQQYPEFDVQYVKGIIHDVEAKYSIDHGRVFVAGHSLGGEMAHRMGCDASDDVAAIASLAGQVTKDPAGCAPARAVSAVEIHGTLDQTIGYNGDVQNSPPDPSVPSAHETIAVWARNDACTGAIAATGTTYDLDVDIAGSETTVEAYAGCPTGIAAELWTINGGVHRPGLTPSFAPTVWSFLGAHARN